MIKLSSDGPIVMVDDNAGDRFFVERCFDASKISKERNPWLACAHGLEFLAMLEQVKAGQLPMPALVLLDLNMPGMNGLDVLSVVRADQSFNELPVFCVLTSSHDPRDAQAAERLHASGFVTKASSMQEYVSFFDELVS